MVTVEPALSPQMRSWRIRIFAATWLSYVGFYFCRKPFSIAKASLGNELSFNATMLGTIGAAYLVAYAIGQFIAGWAGDRKGPRILLLIGMAVSLGTNVGFGLADSYATFVALMVLNGLVQATGWSCNVGTMANWFHRGERGRVMGFWATNFTVGGLLAGNFSALVLGALGFRYSFFAGSAVLTLVWIFFFFNQRNRPQDEGLAPLADPIEPTNTSEVAVVVSSEWTSKVVANIMLVGAYYFFAKLIRYALWSWAPFFLTKNFRLEADSAGYLSTLFDLAGIPGIILTGWLSDRFFRSRRVLVSLIMMAAMTGFCLLMYTAGRFSVEIFAVCLVLVGFTLYGPDALLTGAGAMDIGSRRGAVLAAGLISGIGSLGPVAQELVIGKMYDQGGGDLGPIFILLLASAGISTAILLIMQIRNHLGQADV